MVDGINQSDVKALSRYVYDLPADENEIQKTPIVVVGGIGSAKVLDASKWTIDFLKDRKTNWTALKTTERGLNTGNIWNRTKNYNRNFKLEEIATKHKRLPRPTTPGTNPTSKELLELQKYNKSVYYKKVRTLIERGKHLKGAQFDANMAQIEKSLSRANLAVHKSQTAAGLLKPITKMGKAAQFAKKWTGYNWVNGLGLKSVANSKVLRTVGKATRGKGAMTAIALLANAPDLAATYTTLGKDRGNKQLVKDLTVTGVSIAAYAVGAKAGAAAGAAIGSVVPGLGTVIGGVIGTIVGLGCSYFAGEYTQKLVGKPELELAQDEAATTLANQACKDPELLQQLATAAVNKAKENPAGAPAILTSAIAAESATSASAVESITENPEATTKTGAASNKKTTLSESLERTKTRLLAYIKAMTAPPEKNQNSYSNNTYGFSMPQTGMMNSYSAFANPYMANSQFGYMG